MDNCQSGLMEMFAKQINFMVSDIQILNYPETFDGEEHESKSIREAD